MRGRLTSSVPMDRSGLLLTVPHTARRGIAPHQHSAQSTGLSSVAAGRVDVADADASGITYAPG